MSKDTFLHQLRIRLSQLPEAEIENVWITTAKSSKT